MTNDMENLYDEPSQYDLMMEQCAVDDVVTQMLVDELTKQINDEILDQIFGFGMTDCNIVASFESVHCHIPFYIQNNYGVVVLDPTKTITLCPIRMI